MSKAVNKEVEDFKRNLLAKRLLQCTKKQQEFFNKVYPNGVSEDSLVSAIDLCDRTIAKNLKDSTRLEP